MNDSDITHAAIREIAAILPAGYLRYRRAQISGHSTTVPVDSSATASPHGDEVNGTENPGTARQLLFTLSNQAYAGSWSTAKGFARAATKP